MRTGLIILILVAVILAAAGGAWALWHRTPVSPLAPTPNERRPRSTAPSAALPPPPAPQPAPPVSDPWFVTLASETGIGFRHQTGTNPEKPFPAANGSGLAAFDYDLDGAYDLYFVTGTPFPLEAGRTEPLNRCYRNLGGIHFVDVTVASGLGHNGYSAGVTVGDYDSDGFPDVYVNCFGSNVLYQNQGDGTFREVTQTAKVDDERWGTSAAFFDYDDDGLLDLYVCNYAKWTWETRGWCGDRERNVRVHCGPHSVEAEPDRLLHNAGDGTFADTTQEAGVGARAGRAQGVIATDLNRDGRCDLYVSNDLHANFMFVNQGNGAFQDATEISGAAYDDKGGMQAGMGVDAADLTGDGYPDLFVTNFANESNSLYINLGGDLFQESGQSWGLYADSLPWVGWGTVFADFNLDGTLDLVVTNGHVDDNLHLLGEDAPYEQPALAWRGESQRFRLLGNQAGEYFEKRHPGRALITVDLDNDGDQDLVIGHQDQAPALLRNEQIGVRRPAHHSCTLRLIGTQGNRDAIGATVTLRTSVRSQTLQVKGGGSYLSHPDPRLVFALPETGESAQLEIQWPGGKMSTVSGIRLGSSTTILEPRDPESAPIVVVQENSR